MGLYSCLTGKKSHRELRDIIVQKDGEIAKLTARDTDSSVLILKLRSEIAKLKNMLGERDNLIGEYDRKFSEIAELFEKQSDLKDCFQ